MLRDFVWLLNQCLRSKLATCPERLRFDKEAAVYFFPANEDGTPTTFGYKGQKKLTSREVVKVLRSKKERHVMGHRHSAMQGQFNRYGGNWYLEVTPEYRFTGPDRLRTSRFAPDWQSGIKKLENNNAVLGQLVMWEALLNKEGDLFAEPYPFLSFGKLMSFELDRGIDDAAWTAGDEETALASDELPMGLFEDL